MMRYTVKFEATVTGMTSEVMFNSDGQPWTHDEAYAFARCLASERASYRYITVTEWVCAGNVAIMPRGEF